CHPSDPETDPSGLFRGSHMPWHPWNTHTQEDSDGATFAHGIRHGGTRRVNHGHEAHEAQALCGEVDIVTVEGKQVTETWGVESDPRSALPL
uniref:Uncharacterized protein n=1 Tax=Salmo trutta TaxID=8032 RepID=A0A674AAY7_SALTR